VPTPLGDACAGDGAEDVGGAVESGVNWGIGAGGAAGSAVGNAASNWTAPARHWIRDRAQDFVKSKAGEWIGDRGHEFERTFTCIAETVVKQPGSVGCQEEAEQVELEPEEPRVPPTPPPGVPGKTPIPGLR
jgi:hypothetical protein